MRAQVVSDEYINRLFEGTNFGATINESVDSKRKQIVKTLRDQATGYWSGHAAYNIVVDGGFLKDGKKGLAKQLTALGMAFIHEQES